LVLTKMDMKDFGIKEGDELDISKLIKEKLK
jgi:hypothetical protein